MAEGFPFEKADASSAEKPLGESRPQIPDHDLDRVIGAGSYGEVWLARNVMGSLRAVKVVYRKTFESERPYEREFSGIKKFEPISRSHEGFVDILQVGRNDQAGYFYYVMELADDAAAEAQSPLDATTYVPRTLGHEIRRHGRVPIEECLQWALSLTSALRQLHNPGLVHRDIKPSNIIFVDGLPKLADIGLVASVTEARSFVGTVGFIPPEGPGTPQADLYSLGKVLYEMSTGKDRNEFPELPSDARELPEREQLIELNEVLLKACHNDPAKRYPSAEQMHADLAYLQGGRSVRRLHTVERRLALLTKAGIAAVLMAVLAVFAYFVQEARARRAEERRRDAEHLRARAVQAEMEARQAAQEATNSLWSAYLAQARANRWSGRPGRRFDTLDVLKKAAQIRPSLEL